MAERVNGSAETEGGKRKKNTKFFWKSMKTKFVSGVTVGGPSAERRSPGRGNKPAHPPADGGSEEALIMAPASWNDLLHSLCSNLGRKASASWHPDCSAGSVWLIKSREKKEKSIKDLRVNDKVWLIKFWLLQLLLIKDLHLVFNNPQYISI